MKITLSNNLYNNRALSINKGTRFSARSKDCELWSPEDIQRFKEHGFSFASVLKDYKGHYRRTLKALQSAKSAEAVQEAITSFFTKRFKGWDYSNRVLMTAEMIRKHTENPFDIKYGHVNHELLDPLEYFETDALKALRHTTKQFKATKARVIGDFQNTITSFLEVLKIYDAIENKEPHNFQGKLAFFWRNLLRSVKCRYQRPNMVLTQEGKTVSVARAAEEGLLAKAKAVRKTRSYDIRVIGSQHLNSLSATTINNPYEVYIILRNLMTNAIKYSLNRGQIKVRFLPGWGMDSTGQFRRYLMATVEDPGIGVAPSEAYRVMTGNRAEHVLALGLKGQARGFQEAIALTLKHGGGVYMASPTKKLKGVPKGTQVQVMLPLNDAQGAGLSGKSPSTPNAPQSPTPSDMPPAAQVERGKNLLNNAQPIATQHDVNNQAPTLVAFYADKPARAKSKRFKVKSKKRLVTKAGNPRSPKVKNAGQIPVALAK